MTGKEMLQELIGQLSKVDPGPHNIMDLEDEIMDSVINCIPVYIYNFYSGKFRKSWDFSH